MKRVLKSDPSKPNIFLDLDNTLIFSIPYKAQYPDWIKNFKTHEMDNDFLVLERPGLQNFLDWLFQQFNVSIWSAGSPSYVTFIVDNIIKKNHHERRIIVVLNSNDCDNSQYIYGDDCIKKLDMLWNHYGFKHINENNTIILDDLGLVINAQRDNALRIKKFYGKEEFVDDKELIKVQNKLENIINNFKQQKKIYKSPPRKKVIERKLK